MIVHIFNSSVVSGPETLVLPALKALGKPVRIVFLTERRLGEKCQAPLKYAAALGHQTESINVRFRLDLQAIEALAGLLEKLSPQVVHAHDVKASFYLLRAARKLPGRKFFIVSTHHGVRARFSLKLKLYEAFYVRFVLPYFDKVLAVCSTDREILLSRGLKPEQAVLHLNGINGNEVEPRNRTELSGRVRAAWSVKLGQMPGPPVVIGYVGRLAKEKRIDRILEVLSLLDQVGGSGDQSPDWYCLIFGTGPLEEELRLQSERLGINDKVRWMGYRSGIGAEMAGFDLLISLSDAEGLPINLLEAGWAATPVFATAVDGIRDLIIDEQQGVLVDPEASNLETAKRLKQLLSDADGRRRMGEALQVRVKQYFSGDVWLDRLRSIYSELCDR